MSGEPFQAPWAPVTSTSWKGSKKSHRKIIKYIFGSDRSPRSELVLTQYVRPSIGLHVPIQLQGAIFEF